MQPLSRGCHVVTREVLRQVPEIQEYEIGVANFFILHTSASLTISENASPDVPLDMAVRFLPHAACRCIITCCMVGSLSAARADVAARSSKH